MRDPARELKRHRGELGFFCAVRFLFCWVGVSRELDLSALRE